MKLFHLAYLMMLISSNASSVTRELTVSGWPKEWLQMDSKSPHWANNPVLGKMICPALTRLNLLEKRSETQLLSEIKVSDREQKVWSFVLSKGLYWWTGDIVTHEDLADFFDKNLEQNLRQSSMDSYEIPHFDIEHSKTGVKIIWKSKPEFGPWILNQIPFQKQQDGKIVCAGNWQPQQLTGYIEEMISKTPESTMSIKFTAQKSADLTFQYPHASIANAWARHPDQRIRCSRKIDLPIITGIFWNTNMPDTNNPKMRTAFTHLMPRGALLRHGAGYMGDLLSGPFLRAHPGYSKALLVKSYSVETAQKIFAQENYRYKEANGELMRPDGTNLVLKIQVSGSIETLAAKVIASSFQSSGITVEFQSQPQGAHGVLTSLTLPWPNGNLIHAFHSKSKSSWPGQFATEQLDKGLEAYARSLTFSKPDFRQLRKIHKILFDQEPITLLMQHQVCLKSRSRKKLPKVYIRNPDWFQKLTKFTMRTK